MHPRSDCSAAPVGHLMKDSLHHCHYQRRQRRRDCIPVVEVVDLVVVAAEAMAVVVANPQCTLAAVPSPRKHDLIAGDILVL